MVCTCGHSQTDHVTGRCVNRRMYYDPVRNDVVTEVCTCKRFMKAEAPKPPVAEELEPLAQVPAEPEEQAENVPEPVKEEPKPPVRSRLRRR